MSRADLELYLESCVLQLNMRIQDVSMSEDLSAKALELLVIADKADEISLICEEYSARLSATPTA